MTAHAMIISLHHNNEKIIKNTFGPSIPNLCPYPGAKFPKILGRRVVGVPVRYFWQMARREGEKKPSSAQH